VPEAFSSTSNRWAETSHRSRSIRFISARVILRRLGWKAARLSGRMTSDAGLGFGMVSFGIMAMFTGASPAACP
jgi:hypothetical protein